VRKYDFRLGRFRSVDKLFENYRDWNGYQYAACNPMNLTDANGYKIDITEIFESGDYSLTGNKYGTLILDLQQTTGLILSDSSGSDGKKYMTYRIGDTSRSSATARNLLMKAIDDQNNTSVVKLGPKCTSDRVNSLELNYDEIDSRMKPENVSPGLNCHTMGYAITFLHEVSHTDAGGNLVDPPADPLQEQQIGTVQFENKIRAELDAVKSDDDLPMGFRINYAAIGRTVQTAKIKFRLSSTDSSDQHYVNFFVLP
jgi:hypothetical protein